MPSRERAAAAWFAFGVRLFAAALPLGIVVALLTPFAFVQGLGAFVAAASLVGLGLSLAGLRSEAPTRWAQWQQSWASLSAQARRRAH